MPINIHGCVIYGAVAHGREMFHQHRSGRGTLAEDMRKIIRDFSLNVHLCVSLDTERTLKDRIFLLTMFYRSCFRRELEVNLSKTTLRLFQGAAEVKHQDQRQTSSHRLRLLSDASKLLSTHLLEFHLFPSLRSKVISGLLQDTTLLRFPNFIALTRGVIVCGRINESS